MWGIKIEEMCMQFLVYPGFTEEQIHAKILEDEVIFMDEAVYQFMMFAIHHDFKNALNEVREGLEYSPEYIFECPLAAVSQDGNVVLLFKAENMPENVELTEGFKSKVFPELLRIRLAKPPQGKVAEEKPEEDSEPDSDSDDIDWL